VVVFDLRLALDLDFVPLSVVRRIYKIRPTHLNGKYDTCASLSTSGENVYRRHICYKCAADRHDFLDILCSSP
jgi:hypothetical protein